MSARTAAERVEELAVEQEAKSKHLRSQRLEAQEAAARLEVTRRETFCAAMSSHLCLHLVSSDGITPHIILLL